MNEPTREDPSEKPQPPAEDPQIRKGPLEEPPTKQPSLIDPPATPHVPGDPERRIEDPRAPDQPEERKDPAVFV